MAFTEGQKTLICRILEVTPRYLNAQLDYLGAELTADIQTAVGDELDRWESGAGANFTRIHPTAANFGAEINPDAKKADIRTNIAVLLEMPGAYRMSAGSRIGTIEIGR
jgi:hypothetical protein